MAAGSARNSTNVRLYLLAAILFLWGGAICLRLVYLQIFRYGSFELRAQHQQQHTTEVSARRGIIYDRAGHELAMSIAVDSVFAVPTEMPDLAGTVSLISRITHSDPRELLAKCQAGRTFCWLARKADAETADRIRSLNLRGIYFQKEFKRFYPNERLAAQMLGYVGTDDAGYALQKTRRYAHSENYIRRLAAASMLAGEICSISSVTTSQPRARFAASRESSQPASMHPSTTNRAGHAGSGSSTRMR